MDNELREFLDAQFGALRKDIGTLKSDVGTLKADVGTLKSDVGTLKADVGTLKSDVSVLKADFKEMKDLQESTASHVVQLIHMVSGVSSRLLNMEGKQELTNKRLDRHTHQIAEIQETLALRKTAE